MQEYVECIGFDGEGILIPVVKDNKGEWYPISFISQKVLGRQKVTSTNLKKNYSEWMSKKKFMYFGGVNYIESNCLNREGFETWIESLHIGRMTDEQIKGVNELCRVFNIDYGVDVRGRYTEKLRDDDFTCYSEYDLDCHDSIVGEFDKYKICSKCKKYYPMHENFYGFDEKTSDGFSSNCKKSVGIQVGNSSTIEYKTYRKYGMDGYSIFKKSLYNFALAYDYDKDYEDYKISHDKYRFGLFDRYLKQNNILITKENLYEHDYDNLLRKSRIYKYYKNKHDFLEDYAMFKFGEKVCGYKLSKVHPDYYKTKHNRIKDMKFYIENDLCLDIIEKIPIYITKNSLQKNCRKLYNLINRYYENSLFNYINQCYPDIFIEEDFGIVKRQNKFDSQDEELIHDILENKFGHNLIYNSGNMQDRITIEGCQPDWIILYKKPIIVEYFGLYVENRSENKIINDYINRSDKKIEIYSSLEHYDKFYIYPEDLKFNFKGLYDKLDKY